jgi:flagellar protein FliS
MHTSTPSVRGQAAAYLRDEVLTDSPLRLVVRVFGGALTAIERARRHADAGRLNDYRHELSRANGLVSELLAALDKQRGGEIAVKLESLYEFVITRLLRPSARPDAASLARAERILRTLKEAFDAVLASNDRNAAD